MVNRSVLCNCGIEVDNHYLLEPLAACDNKISKLTMYFTINTAFTNYLEMFPNLTDSLQTPLIKKRTTYKPTLPIALNVSKFDRSLLHVSMDLKDFMDHYTKRKEIFDLQEKHDSTFNTNKNFFSNNHILDIFVFVSSIMSLMSTTFIIYLICKHKKIRTLVGSLALHQIKEVSANSRETNPAECTTLAYIGIILTILSLILVTFLHFRKSRLCKGLRFSNVVKIISISDVQNYMPIKLCKATDSVHLHKIIGTLKAKNIKLNKNYLWDTLEINWKEVTVTFNDNKKNLPKIVAIKLQDKIKVRRLMNRKPLLFHLMLKQGITWFTLATEIQESTNQTQIYSQYFIPFPDGLYTAAQM